jgi:RNA polymerase sigma factor (sigma-70 family)
MSIRVAIVEDRAQTLASLSSLLGESRTIEVVGGWTTGEQALDQIPELKPEVVLVDLGLPGISGIELIRALKEALPSLELLVLTIYEDRHHLFQSLKAGASGYLLKDATPEEISDAIVELSRGGAPMSPKVARYVIESFHESCPDLTRREQEILRGLAAGLTYRRLAEELGLSPHTVRSHIKRIYEKLHVHSKLEAVLWARGGTQGEESRRWVS